MTQLQSHPLLPYDIGDRPVPGYTLRRYLGGGAIGHVWLAETDSGFQQAIKVVDLRDAGGRKEFRGLRTVKQRRLLSGNLLTLIDYWLKDTEGNLLADLDEEADSFFGNSSKPQSQSSPMAATQSQTLDKTEDLPAKGKRPTAYKSAAGEKQPNALSKGTLVSSDDDLAEAPTLMAPAAMQPAKASGSKRPPVQLIVAMELGHKTLFDRMKECRGDGEGPGIPLEELLPYMEHAARGLDYLHREGILHRDVKPHNIMLVGDVAKVCDYGLVVADDYDLSKTSKAYTPYYASPEAVANKALTGRTDQYSLAVAYVEVRAGQLPYSSETAAAVYAAKETGNYELKGISNPLVRKVLKKALAKEPRERYTTCVEFIKDLARAERTRPKASGFGRLVAAALIVLLLAGLGGALAYGPSWTFLVGLLNPARPIDPKPDPKVPDPDPQPDDPSGDPGTPKLPESPTTPGSADPESPPEKKGKGTEPPPEASPSSEQALARLAERVAKLSAGESPPGAREEAEVFAFLDAAIRAGAKASDLADARTRVAEKTFLKYLSDDAPLADQVQRGEVLRRAALLGSQDPAPRQTPPLVTFVAAEAEVEKATATGQPNQSLKDQRALVAPAVAILEKAGDSAEAALLDYGRFVLARVSAETSAALSPAEMQPAEQLLLQWPAVGSAGAGADAADWRTPRRTRHAAELLARLGEASFTLTDNDILRFHTLAEGSAGKAADFLDKARSLGATTPQVLGLLSVVRALGPQMIEQRVLARAVADASSRALADDDAKAGLVKGKRAHLVAYVGAVATARLKDVDNANANRAALAWFASRLEDPSVFEEASRGGRDDAGVLENLVLPALAISVADPAPSELRPPLAAIWGALGRLIERNPSFVEIPGVPRESHPDTDTAALLTAHRAYAQARQLDTAERYASGFGRTLLKLPRDVFEQQNGIELLKQVMPTGPTQDQGLLLVAARLLRREAQRAGGRSEKLKLLDDSLSRYASLLAQTAINDPFALASLAQVSASATHLEAAFFTSIEAADEARRAAGAAAAAEMTKFEHLQRAVEFAAAAKLDQARQLPEEAYIAEGNAHEDLAHYYKLITHYPEAIAAFDQATRESGVVRSSIYAWTCKGRAEFRAAVDAADIAGDFEKRQALFRQAFASLTRAVAEGKQEEPRYLAEAEWWLGQVLYASVLYGPGDLTAPADSPLAGKSFGELRQMLALKASEAAAQSELRSRLKVWESCMQHFQRAAETAETGWKSEWPLVLRDGMQTRLDLAEMLGTLAAYAPQLNRGKILEGIAADAQKVLDLAQQQPESVGAGNVASALVVLAAAKKELPVGAPAGPKAGLEVLRQGESLFSRPDNAWRAQRVEVILQQAQHYEKSQLPAAEKDIERAEEVARSIDDARLALQARGNCARVHADVIYQALAGEFGNSKLDRKLLFSLEQAEKLYVQAEASLASADDARTEPNLALLRRQSFVSLENNRFKPDLTELEVYRLRKFILRTRVMRIQASSILTVLLGEELLQQHMNTKFSTTRAAQAKHFRELLTPVAYLGKYIPPDLRTILQRVDHKLGL